MSPAEIKDYFGRDPCPDFRGDCSIDIKCHDCSPGFTMNRSRKILNTVSRALLGNESDDVIVEKVAEVWG